LRVNVLKIMERLSASPRERVKHAVLLVEAKVMLFEQGKRENS